MEKRGKKKKKGKTCLETRVEGISGRLESSSSIEYLKKKEKGKEKEKRKRERRGRE